MKADWYWRLYISLFSLHCLQNYLLRIHLGYPLLVVMTSFHWTLNRHNKCWKVYWNTSKHDLETNTFISFHVYWRMLTKIKIKNIYGLLQNYTIYENSCHYCVHVHPWLLQQGCLFLLLMCTCSSVRGSNEPSKPIRIKKIHSHLIICDKGCQWLTAGRWFSPVSSTNKTDRHDISEILLKVVLNIINLPSI